MMDTLKNSKVVRFAAIGVLNTALDFGLLFVFKALGLPVVVANILSTSIAFSISFTLNKKYTFKTSGTNVKRELALFIAVTLFGLWVLQSLVITLISPLVAAVIHTNPELTLFIAKLAATVVSMVWNFIMYDRVVFTHKQPRTER